ncbi:ferredoxin--NADP reductase [Nocardioides piscis]|uniref:Ferredoxin--NADP reductase n=1 Tax=Nocardioides piscis TaxID=2714938 RepID=A0A6G7YIT1_9ACTN|nr:ferredoxin--NADP reductase [Nocardioides piscis]QIK76651.1 ferredoxin--NADP reductase [Nocardioides piscis]
MDTDSFFLEVTEVVRETEDASSIVFSVPDEAADLFAFAPGQFLTLGVPSEETGLVARCYSICTPPGEPLTVTVKRTVGGYASNWLNDNLRAGDRVRVLPPSGIFTPKDWSADLLLFAGGSGITPILSIVRTAMRDHSGRVVLFYANRDERSVIFAEALTALAAEHPGRLQVFHWLESVQSLPSEAQLREFASAYSSWTSYCCGPAPYMSAVSNALRALDFPRARRHQEKFVSLGGNPFGDVEEVLAAQASLAEADDADEADEAPPAGPTGPVKVEVELDGEQHVFDDWQAGEKLLDFLESKGVKAPYSCREGECSACAIRLVSGEVTMLRNDVLDAEDLAEGIRLGCQSVPASEETVKVSYS